jgi:response regulator RpfG family c-di-GMP phosphodiesterase
MASPADLLAQSLSVLQDIKALVYPQPVDFMPDELNIAVIGECQGLGDVLARMAGVRAALVPADQDAVARVRNARPPFHMVFLDCMAPAKVMPASIVAALVAAGQAPVVVATSLARPWHQQAQACVAAGAADVVTVPTTPDVVRATCTEALKSLHVAKNLQQNVSAHASLLSHLSKILMEQDHYLHSLSEHLALMERWKRQSEKLIVTLQSEVAELHRVNKTHQQLAERLKVENAAMKWKRVFDVASKAKKSGAIGSGGPKATPPITEERPQSELP